jgi:glycerophosphoryl diester phosphodiesterase
LISIERRDGRPLRVGHRGAPALAPANTLPSFRAAIEVGVDLVEFDVVALEEGELVVAHSYREIVPDTPTLEEVLGFFVDEAPDMGIHIDLKLTRREGDVMQLVQRFGLAPRTFVSSTHVKMARAIAEADGDVRTGFTIPRRVLRISDEGRSAPIARAGLRALRAVVPRLVRPLLRLTRAEAIVLHHSIVTVASVRAAHARGVPVVAWTVDEPGELARVDEAGVDAVVSNDPRIFL